ncbi:MAG: C13 family peptidase [Accumulibacter sp.]|jgi:hypothetical protein|uniref:C13 family peptidase n=1 Tax=Accumulibacter sp. TaxID=2053492 RepID=UPI002FC2AC67
MPASIEPPDPATKASSSPSEACDVAANRQPVMHDGLLFSDTDPLAHATLAAPAVPVAPPGVSVIRWLHEGMRSALLLQPRWQRLHAHPLAILVLLAFGVLLTLGVQRLWIVGPASFNWSPLLTGWLLPAATAWVCYALLHRTEAVAATVAPSAAHLFCLLMAQGAWLSALFGLAWAAVAHSGDGGASLMPSAHWALWTGTWIWLGLAQTLTLWRGARRKGQSLLLATILLALAIAESEGERDTMWIADASATASDQRLARLRLTQELMERQPQLLGERLQALQPQRKGVIEIYVLTFAPYAHEDVFRRESALVADVLEQRFDAAGRTLQLINHVHTSTEWPWATPLNLQRAIRHIARLMDRNEDILFIHLTSHGAQDGELSANFWPMSVDAVTPQLLKTWLDEAGVRHRVVSVSACYSGSWIQPLQGDGTLVMTAADAEHTSYGCGRKSELTYFGKAVYDEQLRHATRSFEQAHAAARTLIDEREQQAGKNDGYSNPQIAVGDGVRKQLEKLRRRLEAG